MFLRIVSAMAIVGVVAGVAPAKARKFDAIVPIVVAPGEKDPAAGQTTSVTVWMNGTSTTSQAVSITTDQPGAFTNLPSSVTVPANEDHVTFYVTIGAYGNLNASIGAMANRRFAMSMPMGPAYTATHQGICAALKFAY